jgi:predicted CxxxxCH...CXXCH cytochrome family protein
VDGVLQLITTCNGCHGSAGSNAPPRDVAGNTARTARGVGSHQPHLVTGSTWHRDVACTDCHLVPAALDSPGHLDATPAAELVWSLLSSTSGVTPSWNGSTCTTACHGASMGGAAPSWAPGGAAQAACGTCHGLPPPSPHPAGGTACSVCHSTMAADGGFRSPQRHIDGVLDVSSACDACHGSGGESAPPQDLRGNTATTAAGVGAHRSHLKAATGWHRNVLCSDCHAVPATITAPGHLDTPLPAEVLFSAVANAGGVTSSYTGTTCATWCHGSVLGGRTVATPGWTQVDAGQAACGACHGLPPPAPHPSIGSTQCGVCHPNAAGLSFSDPARHIDGVVDLNQACNSCHGSPTSNAPPRDLAGNTSPSARGVGAHQAHLTAGSTWHRDLPCTDCHVVPAHVEDPGHIDVPPADLTWGPVARAGNVFPSFDGGTCVTACHGASFGMAQPTWTGVGSGQAACGKCHGLPPPAPHPSNPSCERCHPNAGPGNTFTLPQQHVDGVVQLATACNGCHGSATNPAPPTSTTGATSTADRTVGAHQAHLAASSWHAPVPCGECHVVPSTWSDPGHIGPSPAQVTFGPLARTGGAAPAWTGATCTNSYCHGAAFPDGGGSNVAPAWTVVNGSQAACGTCHGLPPGGDHPASALCGSCHAAVVGLDGGFVDASLHIDGLVQAGSACGSCHALPPATGTHLRHAGLAAPTYAGLGTAAALPAPTGYAFGCGTCHPLDAALHHNGGRAEVELSSPNAPAGTLKALSPLGTYTPGATVFTDATGLPYTQGTCANVYCHSTPSYAAASVPTPAVDFAFTSYPIAYPAYALAAGRTYSSPVWGGAPAGCGGCHGFPIRPDGATDVAMAGQSHSWRSAQGTESGHGWNHGYAPLSCRTCHAQTVTQANATSRDAGLSVYGAVPVASFGLHVNGQPDVAFNGGEVLPYPTVKSMGSPTYNAATRTCTNVTCHLAQTQVRSGQPYREGLELECNVCHQQ